ncbi:MAG: hypothetical protein P1V81_04790 [Planctomycetota bacterium]|nr:hypothetical protein [Planctomycetota bacterium]
MEPILILIKVTVAALAAAGLVLFAAARLGTDGRPRRYAGAALIAALIGAYLAQYGLPTLPFGEDSLRAHTRLFWVLPIGLIATLLPWRRALLPVAVLVPLVIMQAFDGGEREAAEWLSLVGLVLAFCVVTATGDLVFRRRDGAHTAVQLGLFAGAAAGVIGATGTMAYAQWAGALGTAWGLTVLLAWRAKDAGRLDGATLALFASSFLLLATRFSELDPFDAALLIAALPMTVLAEDFFEARRARTAVSWLVLLAVLATVALRVYLAWESDPYADYY